MRLRNGRKTPRMVSIGMVLAILWSLSWPRPTKAQWPGELVHDPAVFAQAVDTVANTLELVQASIAELTSLSNLGAISNILAHVEAILGTLQNISSDIEAFSRDWDTLTGEDHRPTNAIDLSIWNYQASGLAMKCATKAMAAQNLLVDAINSLHDAQQLFSLIASLVGNLSAMQLVAGQLASMKADAVRAAGMIGPYHQAMLNPVIIQTVNEQVGSTLSNARLEGFGTMGPVPNLLEGQ